MLITPVCKIDFFLEKQPSVICFHVLLKVLKTQRTKFKKYMLLMIFFGIRMKSFLYCFTLFYTTKVNTMLVLNVS